MQSGTVAAPRLAVASAGDAAVAVGIRRGDEQCMAEVYRRHAASLSRRAQQLCGYLADDVVHDVFVRLWQQPERFDPDRGSLTGYLMMAVHSRAVERMRSESARHAREQRQDEKPPQASVETAVVVGLDRARVQALLARLPHGEREAICLAFLDGWTYRDVARVLGEPEGTVKSRIRRGLFRLREWWPDEDRD